jgi:Tfp pilus assembly protein PilZ
MPYQERRVNKRVATEFKVSYVHLGDYLISYTKDISVDGMFIYTQSPLQVGELPILTFFINGSEISVQAEVIWANTSPSLNDVGMGVKFLDPPKKLRQAILKTVNKIAIFSPK